MKILIIIGCNPSKAPYIQYYIKTLNDLNCSYDIVYWNRDNIDEKLSSNYYAFNNVNFDTDSKIDKICGYFKFRRFVISHIKKNRFDKVIIFTLQSAILFGDILCRKFKKKFIFDIRDYSTLYSINICKVIINKCLKYSFVTSISSPGFIQWLPKKYKYILGHNVHQDLVSGGLTDTKINTGRPIKILTIGQIRDVEENYNLIQSIANDNNFSLTFIGIGDGIKELEKRVVHNGYNNIYFKGRYNKKDENKIVSDYDMINAFMPDNILSRTLMSNRIYLSLLIGKPIIVTDKSTQAEYVKKYNLGICITNTINIKDTISSYWENYDKSIFDLGRINFLEEVKSDINTFENTISEFVNYTK